MPLAPGSTLAHYSILAPLGAGAMGEVYRARDSKLGREVAIKVLPEHFAADADRLKRFEREAQTLASLNHPHVAQIYGVDQVGDICFLVLELVEGESLEDRLKRGALPLDEALDVCRQIAEGLEAAHEAGVIHRDLKPANVRLTPDGNVKVLDFGLAKLMRIEPAPGAALAGAPVGANPGSSTDSVLSTEHGRLLGTPTYMAPEQARGKPIDKRVDIWAFGCVLYECLTASRAFAGETLSDVLAAVIEREADLSKLPAATPARVRELLQRCLVKDVKQRLQAIGEARIVLATGVDRGADARLSPHARQPASVPRESRSAWPWLLASLAVIGFIGWAATAVIHTRGESEGPVALRTSLALPDSVSIPVRAYGGSVSLATLAISPLGDQVVYTGLKDGVGALYLRPLDSFDTVCLTGTEGALEPFFSPDGKRLAFFARGRIWRIDLPGGIPVDVGATGWPSVGGSWSDGGTIVYSPNYADSLWTVPAEGGEPRALTTLDQAAGELSHRWPHVLPGGAAVLFTIKSSSDESLDDARIAIADLATGQHRVLVEGGSFARYLDSGRLVYARAGRLYAVAFDLASATVRGAPAAVLDDVATQPMNGAAWYDITRQGLLTYLECDQDAASAAQFSWEGSGQSAGAIDIQNARFGGGVRLSRDPARAVARVSGANEKLWLVDLEQRNATPLTTGGGNDSDAALSPDGRWLLFVSDRDGGAQRFYRAPLDGSAPPALWFEGGGIMHSISYAPSMVGLTLQTERDGRDAYVLSIAPDGTPKGPPILVAGGPADQANPSVSADGALVAYQSRESGRDEIYVAPLADLGGRRRVSYDGGSGPLWSRDGSRLFYSEPRGIVSMALLSAAELRFDAPTVVTAPQDPDEIYGWDVGADGSSVLVQRVADPFMLRRDLRLWPDWGASLTSGR